MRRFLLYLQSALYILAGLNHFRKLSGYVSIIPHWLPWPLQLVYISGVTEIMLGILLLFRSSRRLAAWGIIVLLIAIFPANIQMASDYLRTHDPAAWVTILRLPIQFLLIWLALAFYGPPEQCRPGKCKMEIVNSLNETRFIHPGTFGDTSSLQIILKKFCYER